MKVLFLSPRQCWPADTGAKLREYHLARQLSRKANVHVLAFADSALTEGLSFCREVITVPRPPRYTAAKLIRGAVGKMPVSVLNYRSDEMRAMFERLLQTGRFDAVQFEGTVMAGYYEILSALRVPPLVLFDWHNIESELMWRYAGNVANPAKRWYARATARRIEALESAMLGAPAAHLVCSEREKEELMRIAPQAIIECVPNGVDTEAFSDAALASAASLRPSTGNGPELVFVGSMNYQPNIEAAFYFARDIWPGISRRISNLRLTLVGTSPAQAVRDLAAIPGVEVTGTVPDTRAYYANASAAIVPLLTGGGTRLKILEAMAAGVPVISTAIGAEGLELEHEQHILLANSEPEWHGAIERVLSDRVFARALASRARDYVRRKYDWQIAGRILYETCEKLLAARSIV